MARGPRIFPNQTLITFDTDDGGPRDWITGSIDVEKDIRAGRKLTQGGGSGGAWYDVTHPKWNGGAKGTGGDDTTAITQAAQAAMASNGGIVLIPPSPTGTPTASAFYGVSATLPFGSGVTYMAVANSNTLKWIGGDPGVETWIIGNVATAGVFTDRPAIIGITVDGASNGHVSGIRWDSVRRGFAQAVFIKNCNGGAHGDARYGWSLLASVGNTSANNTALCQFVGVQFEECRRGYQFNGNQNGTGVTNNEFYGGNWLCDDAWADFQMWCDSNYFYGITMGAAFSSDGSFRGITLGNAVSDLGVHSERFYGCSMDHNAAGMATAVAIVFNICASCRFHDLFSGVGNVHGITTLEQGTLYTYIQGSTTDCLIDWVNQAAATTANLHLVIDIGTQRRHLSTLPGTGTATVNGLTFQGAATGNPPAVAASGTDVNTSVALNGQGIGGVSLNHHRPNWIDVNGAPSGGAVTIQANGVDAAIPIHLSAKGAGEVRLAPQQANFLAVFGAAAASHPQLVSEGSDANPNIQVVPKGAGLSQVVALSPGTDGAAVQTGRLFQGSGVPANGNGNNGDVYLRTDTPAVANQRIYNRQAGAWVGIL